jgi:hypothetical protein
MFHPSQGIMSNNRISMEATFHDQAGRVTGLARTDLNGVTEFQDAHGRTIGKARTDLNGVTRFYDASGRQTGSVRRP